MYRIAYGMYHTRMAYGTKYAYVLPAVESIILRMLGALKKKNLYKKPKKAKKKKLSKRGLEPGHPYS